MRRLPFTSFAIIGFVVPLGTMWAQPANALWATAASPSSPATGASDPRAMEVASKTAGPDRIVCRERIVTGSRLAYARDCHTRAEWEEITRAARDYINGQQLKGLNAAPPND
ncbi:MAG TPA: hypothetical protein VHW69_18235 [Rhizomicrobium sp.]|nr:hypothetical protein [Rhizomicrobium sp.]